MSRLFRCILAAIISTVTAPWTASSSAGRDDREGLFPRPACTKYPLEDLDNNEDEDDDDDDDVDRMVSGRHSGPARYVSGGVPTNKNGIT